MNSKRKYSSIVSSLLVFAMFVSVLGLTPLAYSLYDFEVRAA